MEVLSEGNLKELYQKNFPLWIEANLRFLKEGLYHLVDWENLLEELEDITSKYLDDCVEQLAKILTNIYLYDNFQKLPDNTRKDWIKNIENARDRIKASFKKYPHLETKLPLEIENAWIDAVVSIREWLRNNDYNIEEFNIPEKCPYSYEEAVNRDFNKEFNLF